MVPFWQWIRITLGLAVLAGGLGLAQDGAAQGTARLIHKDNSLILARVGRARTFAELALQVAATERVRVIVRLNLGFRSEADLSAAQQVNQQIAIDSTARTLRAELDAVPGASIDGFESLDRLPFAILTVDAAGLRALQNSLHVAGIQEDVPERIQLDDSGELIGAAGALGVHGLGYTGAGYAVAILDTGVEKDHPFLNGRVVAEACFSSTIGILQSTTLCPNGTNEEIGADSALPCSVANPDPTGACAHGTHVAGIASGNGYAAMTSDGASAVYDGVAPDADIIAVQVFSRFDSTTQCGASATPCYLTFSSDQLRALNWLAGVAETYNLAAVNMSLGGTTKFTAACDGDPRKAGIDNLRSAGVATFIASGNSGYSDGLGAPACISSAISVGSVRDGGPGATPADAVSAFSNSASILSMLAPGEWIEASIPGDAFGVMGGTSMAAPHAAGAWLLMRQMYPAETLDELLNRMLNDGVPVTDSRNAITRPRVLLIPPTATATATPAPSTSTPTLTATLTASATATATATSAINATITATESPTETLTPIGAASPTATATELNGATATATLAVTTPAADHWTYLPALQK